MTYTLPYAELHGWERVPMERGATGRVWAQQVGPIGVSVEVYADGSGAEWWTWSDDEALAEGGLCDAHKLTRVCVRRAEWLVRALRAAHKAGAESGA